MKEYEQKTSECKSIHVDHYINVTPVRASPTGLNVDISQVEHSWQDPEEFHLLVRLHTCNFNIYNVKDFLFYRQRYIVRAWFDVNILTQNGESIASALQVWQIISTRYLHLSSLVSVAEILRSIWTQ